MTRLIALAIAIAIGGFAHASDGYASLDAATSDKIKTMLTSEGYEVRKVEVEDGMYEAYAMKDGKRYEIYLDRDLKIVKTEQDD